MRKVGREKDMESKIEMEAGEEKVEAERLRDKLGSVPAAVPLLFLTCTSFSGIPQST